MEPSKNVMTRFGLRFIVVRVNNPSCSKEVRVNALLDDGANLTTMSRRAAAVLSATGTKGKASIAGYGGRATQEDAEYCFLNVESCVRQERAYIKVAIVVIYDYSSTVVS